jgi:hypothetical protein
VAIIVKAIKAEAVKEDKMEEVVIKAEVNIKVEDVVIELKEEVITIALIIDYYY